MNEKTKSDVDLHLFHFPKHIDHSLTNKPIKILLLVTVNDKLTNSIWKGNIQSYNKTDYCMQFTLNNT